MGEERGERENIATGKKGRKNMKIEVYGSAREIADLVFALQGRQEANEERFSTQTISDRHLRTATDCTDLKIGLSGKYVG